MSYKEYAKKIIATMDMTETDRMEALDNIFSKATDDDEIESNEYLFLVKLNCAINWLEERKEKTL